MRNYPHIILLGKPGSGKGTKSNILEKQGYYHLGGSDVLRENSTNENATYYKEAKHALDTGTLISSDIINGMMEEKIKSLQKTDQPIVFDGYPRTIEQADFLISLFDKNDIVATYLDISDDILIQRIENRLTCVDCSKSIGKDQIEKDSKCSHCGGLLVKRTDDNAETLKHRLSQFNLHTKPMINYLQKKMAFIKPESLL